MQSLAQSNLQKTYSLISRAIRMREVGNQCIKTQKLEAEEVRWLWVNCAFEWRGLAKWKKGSVVESRGQDSRGWGVRRLGQWG